MNTVVFDTCALIRLFKGNALSCLPGLFEKIYIPRAVRNECHDEPVLKEILKPHFETRQVERILPIGLGAGER